MPPPVARLAAIRTRRTIQASLVIALVVVVAFTAAAFYTRDAKPKLAAKVGRTTISTKQVDAIVGHARAEAKREGKPFPPRDSALYKALRRQALELLVYHEELDQSARSLGVTISEKDLEAATRGLGEGEAGSSGADEAFRRESLRAELLYRRIYERIARTVRVSSREVGAYYRAHAAVYRLRGQSVAAARRSVAATLREMKSNAAMARWVSRMRREFAPKIRYAAEFRT
jgi:hypothetical protein